MTTPFQNSVALTVATLLCGCLAGAPKNGPECNDDDGKPCPAGELCVLFECHLVCQDHWDCDPAEACVSEICGDHSKSCGRHEDCIEGFYCNNGACAKKAMLGVVCTMDAGCRDDMCVQGVCCNSPCDETCKTCVFGDGVGDGDDGVCDITPAGEDPKHECAGVAACDGRGNCFDNDIGIACSDDYQCRSGSCTDRVCCNAVCDGVCESCATGYCDAIALGQDPDNECPGTAACNPETRTCFDGVLGDNCDEDYECQDGLHCSADGVCCNQPCDGVCQRCDAPSNVGTCVTVTVASDPDTCGATVMAGDCTIGPCACDPTGTCKESGAVACTDDCALGPCLDGVCCTEACLGGCMSCNGDITATWSAHGQCGPILLGEDPRDQCNGSLATACDGAGACFAIDNGQVCDNDYECASGFCTDGVCCNSRCDGECRVCDGRGESSDLGVCSDIQDAEDPDLECAWSLTCNGGGACYDNSAGSGRTCAHDYECYEGSCCGTCYPGWAGMNSGVTTSLAGVWGTSSSNVYAVGRGGTIIHYDGNAADNWQTQVSNTTQDLIAIDGTSATNVFAVGKAGTIVRYNNGQWQVFSTPTTDDLIDVAVSGNSRLHVMSETAVYRYDGHWADVTPPITDGALVGLAFNGTVILCSTIVPGGEMLGRSVVYRAGESSWVEEWGEDIGLCWPVDFAASQSRMALGYDCYGFGDGYSLVVEEDGFEWRNSVGFNRITLSQSKVFGIRKFTVGLLNPDAQVEILRDASIRTEIPTTMEDIWAASDCDVFAVGGSGAIIRY